MKFIWHLNKTLEFHQMFCTLSYPLVNTQWPTNDNLISLFPIQIQIETYKSLEQQRKINPEDAQKKWFYTISTAQSLCGFLSWSLAGVMSIQITFQRSVSQLIISLGFRAMDETLLTEIEAATETKHWRCRLSKRFSFLWAHTRGGKKLHTQTVSF